MKIYKNLGLLVLFTDNN